MQGKLLGVRSKYSNRLSPEVTTTHHPPPELVF
jgi:hypothetical protein